MNTHRNSRRRITTKPSFETKNINQESDNINDRTTSEHAGVRTQHSKKKQRLQQYHVVWLVEQKKTAGRRVSSGRGRTDRQVNSTGRALQTTPDASRQRRSKSGGINAAITDSSACITQPHSPVQTPPRRTNREEALGFGTRSSFDPVTVRQHTQE